MHTEAIEYEADGARRFGYLAVDRARSGKRPGILIAHEASGVSDIVKQRARLLAELGYVAFALDYVGGGEVVDMQRAMALLKIYNEAPDRIRAITRTSLDV